MTVSGHGRTTLASEEIEISTLIGLQNMLVVEPVIATIEDRLRLLPGCTPAPKFVVINI